MAIYINNTFWYNKPYFVKSNLNPKPKAKKESKKDFLKQKRFLSGL